MDWVTLTSAKGTVGGLADWLNDSRIALVPGAGSTSAIIVGEAETSIYNRLRHWKMLSNPITTNLVIGQDYITSPSDMIEPNFIVLTPTPTTGQQTLVQKPMQTVVSSWSYNSNQVRVNQMPRIYYFDNDTLRFDSPPDLAYPVALVYYQQPPSLSATNTTNFLTSLYPRLFRCACMMMAAEWIKDSGQGQYNGKDYWTAKFEEEIQIAQMASDRAHRAVTAGPIMYDGFGETGFDSGIRY